MIVVDQLVKSFRDLRRGEVRAVDCVSFTARRGEILYLHHLVSLYTEGLENRAEAIRWGRNSIRRGDLCF